MMQMVPVPVFPNDAYPSQRFEYSLDDIVLVAGQYREIRPVASPAASAQCQFHSEPAELPSGLQLDPSTGIIWGTPLPPPQGADASGTYQNYTIIFTGPAGTASTQISIK